jgi:hypothetical protein
LLKRKKKLQDIFERIETGALKPQEHTFGMKTEWEEPGALKSLLHSDVNETARQIELQEARYQPHLQNKTLKPPRPTRSSLIRERLQSK